MDRVPSVCRFGIVFLSAVTLSVPGCARTPAEPSTPTAAVSAADSATKPTRPAASTQSKYALPESERQYIWDVEHVVLVLDMRFWPRLAGAIRSRDRDGMHSVFAPESATELLNDGTRKEELLSNGRVQTRTAGESPSEASLSDLSEYFSAIAGGFASEPQVTAKTVFLSPASRDESNTTWNGRAQLRIWGETAPAKPAEYVIEAEFQLVNYSEDVPNPAPWIARWKLAKETFYEANQYLMRETGAAWGFDTKLFHDNWRNPDAFPELVTGGVYLCDYDVDGLVDVLITDTVRCALYRQVAPGKFRDVTREAGLAWLRRGLPAAFGDFDNDSYPDLIVDRFLYRNARNGKFHKPEPLNLAESQIGNGFALADYDRDGWLDVYVSRAAPDPLNTERKASWIDDRTGPGNSLLRNRGNGVFEDVTASANASAGHLSCFAVSWLDANDDLWPDLFASDEFGSPVLLVNQRDGTFAQQTITGAFGGFCMGVAAGDLDNDGRTDLYLANMYSKAGERVLSNLNLDLYPEPIAAKLRKFVEGSELWHNQGDLTFTPAGRSAGVARVGWAYGPALADLDNDGWLDIYAPAGFYSVSRGEPDG